MNTPPAPASGLQRGLWFMDHWTPGSAAYNIPWVFEFDRAIDPGLLERALSTIIQRHEALRTTFLPGPDGPVQVIHPNGEADLAINDLREHPAAVQPGALAALLEAESRKGFDLGAGPLLRAALVLGSAVPTTLILVIHHIVWDGWSAWVFERELAELYCALEQGREPVLPELTAQYADYARAERAESYEAHLAYWREALRDAPARISLATDRPHQASRSFAGHTEEFVLPAGTSARVRALASAEDATSFVVQLAAFAVLLSRYCGTSDLVIGTPVTTRNRAELEDLVGYFVNIVPLRVRLNPRATFRELIGEVRDVAFEAYAYLDVPFDTIVDALGLARSAWHAPLVQVVFGTHAEDPAPLRLGVAHASRRVHHNGTSKFDLTWSTFDDGELRGEAEFSTGLFETSTVLEMAGRWCAVLAAALDDPDLPLWRLGAAVQAGPPGLASAQRMAVPAGPEPGATQCLHHAFEDTADRFPDRPALSSGTTTLTYAELDVAANRLASALIAAGVRRGDRVGLLLDRSARTIITILAVLKVGAAYVPVDLTAPPGRAAFVFGDTGVGLVVTDQGQRVPRGPWRLFDLDERAADVAAQPPGRPGVRVSPGDLVYLIFTSGSTGQPKGVGVSHEHVSRLMASGLRHFGFAETDVWTLFHSYAFDWTVWEMWGALHHGGRLIMVPYLVSRDPHAFAELLAGQHVTCLCLTPSALRQLERTLQSAPRTLPGLRWVMLGGEALDPAVVRRWFALPACPPATLCNLYGITETTVHVTTYDLPGPAAAFERSLIGTALPHLTALVLDEWLRPCPTTVVGELYIAGQALAQGYWGRPGLTAQRFLPDPTGGGVPGSRLYRTGDVARRLADGGLEYVGRSDKQIKIHGFRIEPGEIENALSAHPAVQTCVVTAYGDDEEDRRLAVYITISGPAPDYAELRDFLGEALPAYMIPATVTVLDTLPLTVNGKVDQARLPAPGLLSAGSADRYQAPATPTEKLLSQVWTNVLGVPGIGTRDNFFHLGGDSIQAVRLLGELRERGWILSLSDLFAAPTVAALAPLLQPSHRDADPAATAVFTLLSSQDRAALPEGVTDAYPMVSMQLSMIYHMELSGGAGNYHNVNSYRVTARLDEQVLREALADLMWRHPVLRTSLDVSSYSEPLQLVHERVPVPLEVADLSGLTGAEQDSAIGTVFDTHCLTQFDLRVAPLFRVTAQRLGDEAFQLTIAEHHAILDGWSFTSLLTELLERHAELSQHPGHPAAPPPVTTFRDFVVAERAAQHSPESVAYWRDRLTGVTGALDLVPDGAPTDGAEIQRTVEHLIPEAERRLSEAATAAGVPVKAVALATHVLALSRMTGRARVTTGLSVNGRLEQQGATECCGLFLNTVPLTVDLTTVGTSRLDLARWVHAAEVEMLPHRRVPFAQLARFMDGTRLDANFAFLRFHSLGRLAGPVARIVDGRIGCEPTMRHEPTNFALGVALVQDPSSGRALLAVDHLRSLVSDMAADEYATGFLEELYAFTHQSASGYLGHLAEAG